jgi:nuclear transport factor 2 (NTF2) superfamily protein
MNSIKIYKIKVPIDFLLTYIDYTNGLKLLDIKSNVEDYDDLENAVLQISNMHLNRLNIKLDDSIFIEFWMKKHSNLHEYHFDCDEYEWSENKKQYKPLFSCITYLNNHTDPTFISNINYEEYKYKDFDNQLGFSIIYPEKGKHIYFDGTKYHGVTRTNTVLNNDPRYILAINIWKSHKPSKIEYYVSNKKSNILCQNIKNLTFEEDSSIYNIELDDKSKINLTIFDSLLYENNSTKLYELDEYKNISKNLIVNFKKKEIQEILEKKINVKADLDFIKNNEEFNVNRFLQRFIIPQIYSKDICKWIISEGEKYALNNQGWTNHRHNKYPTTDLPVNIIPNIFSFILSSLTDILSKINKLYGLCDVKLNVLDMFLVKYNENLQNELELHKDGSIISLNISLSESTDYEGGGTLFSDGIHYTLEQGDMLVHCGKVKHAGMKITKGNRYLLVAFIDIIV